MIKMMVMIKACKGSKASKVVTICEISSLYQPHYDHNCKFSEIFKYDESFLKSRIFTFSVPFRASKHFQNTLPTNIIVLFVSGET